MQQILPRRRRIQLIRRSSKMLSKPRYRADIRLNGVRREIA